MFKSTCLNMLDALFILMFRSTIFEGIHWNDLECGSLQRQELLSLRASSQLGLVKWLWFDSAGAVTWVCLNHKKPWEFEVPLFFDNAEILPSQKYEKLKHPKWTQICESHLQNHCFWRLFNVSGKALFPWEESLLAWKFLDTLYIKWESRLIHAAG